MNSVSVDEWMVSILLVCVPCGMAVGVLLVYPSPVCVACAIYSQCSTVSTARSCRVLFLVGYRTVRVVSVSPHSLCGGVSSVRPPLVVVVGGGIVDGGACVVVVGGMVMEGRWCYWLPRLHVGALPFSFGWRPC